MHAGRSLFALVTAAALLAAFAVAQPARAVSPSGTRIAADVRALKRQYHLRSVYFGVWVGGRRLATGALGTSAPGVRSTLADHFRIGNITETFDTTVLLKLVEQGRLRLDDPISKWFPDLPQADQVTVAMLARSITGYQDYVTDPAWEKLDDAGPRRRWSVPELIHYAFLRPPAFAPGTSWAFSDTNFVLLGDILRRAGGAPVDEQLQRQILGPLGLRQTAMHFNSHIPAPAVHAYLPAGGRFADTFTWSPTWATYTGNMTSTVGDLGRWARALGTGKVLTAESHEQQVGMQTVGLGPLTPAAYYGMGLVVTQGWISANPQLMGYNGVLSYLPSRRIAIVVFVTQGPKSNPKSAYASGIYNKISARLAPDQAPTLPVCPRPPC